jgi:hypothetical protein
LNFPPQTRQVIASGLTDLLTGTAGSQDFGSLSNDGVDVASGTPENAVLTLLMTDGRSAAATVLFERYEDRICATSDLSSDSDTS